MNNPTLLKANIDKEEAVELIDYLYCEKIIKLDYGHYVCWVDKYNQDNLLAKWTKEYKNIMISKDLLLTK